MAYDLVAELTGGFRKTMYGRCEFGGVTGGDFCRLHKSRGGGSFAVSGRGVGKGCCAPVGELEKDVDFLRMCCDMTNAGFAYLSERGLTKVDRYGNCVPVGVRALGRGYCYIPTIRDKFRMRAARLLGAKPLVAEYLTLFRMCGDSRVSVDLVYGGHGYVHCKPRVGYGDAREFVEVLRDLVAMDPKVRIGADVRECYDCGEVADMEEHSCSDGSVVEAGVSSAEVRAGVAEGGALVAGPVAAECSTGGAAGRGFCDVCKFNVKLDGHASRCRPRVEVSAAAKLVGDALHALDVKRAVTVFNPGTQYSITAAYYMHAASQADWLARFHAELVVPGASPHTLGDIFESNYLALRPEYLKWLAIDLDIDPRLLFLECYDVSGWMGVSRVLAGKGSCCSFCRGLKWLVEQGGVVGKWVVSRGHVLVALAVGGLLGTLVGVSVSNWSLR